jgi:hypothetical protein
VEAKDGVVLRTARKKLPEICDLEAKYLIQAGFFACRAALAIDAADISMPIISLNTPKFAHATSL